MIVSISITRYLITLKVYVTIKNIFQYKNNGLLYSIFYKMLPKRKVFSCWGGIKKKKKEQDENIRKQEANCGNIRKKTNGFFFLMRRRSCQGLGWGDVISFFSGPEMKHSCPEGTHPAGSFYFLKRNNGYGGVGNPVANLWCFRGRWLSNTLQ